MPGNPKLARFEKHIEQLGGDEVVFDLIASGMPMEEVAETFRGFLKGAPDFPSRTWLYTWIKAGGEERDERWREAKRIKAHCLVEDAEGLLEAADSVTQAQVSLLKERVGHKKWLAEKLNREEYGEKKEAGVQILSVGELHLDALRSAGRVELPAAEEEPEAIEADCAVEE